MTLEVIQGDITRMETDAIVNAANSSLLGGGGVDGAIHRAGGSAILNECRDIRNRQGGCPTGEAVITTAGNMPAKFVIHTVGPVWNKGKPEHNARLADCYRNSMVLAKEKGIRSIAFPNISTGVYGFPKPDAARIATETILSLKKEMETRIDRVVFVCFDEESFRIYREILPA